MARSSPGVGLAAALLTIGVIGVLIPYPERPPVADFSLNGWRPDVSRLQASLDADRALVEEYPVDEEGADQIRGAMAALFALGTAEVAAEGQVSDPAFTAANTQALEAMSQYWFDHGEDAYRALGVMVSDASVEITLEILVAASQERLSALAWVDQNPEDDRVQRLHAYTGRFLHYALESGLITTDNHVRGDAFSLLRLHFKHRWLLLVTSIKDYTFLMAPEELRALWRWRLEGQRTLSLEQRIRIGRWLRDIEPAYPIYRTLGAWAARASDYPAALRFYQEALVQDPSDLVVRENIRFLEYALREKESDST